jgi:hypothetical protein
MGKIATIFWPYQGKQARPGLPGKTDLQLSKASYIMELWPFEMESGVSRPPGF